MGCNCKHMEREIEEYKTQIESLRDLFIKRMTIDSETTDRRKREFNQAIFHYTSDEDIEYWNSECENYNLPKKQYGETYPVWSETDMDMVLTCFDDAVKDWRRTFCDVENCRRK